MLMTAHVAYPALDPEPNVPATLSKTILTDLLRAQMGFEGVVVTDCMNMHAIAHNFEPRVSHVRAIDAGVDLLLTHMWDLAYNAIKEAVREGALSEGRVNEAAARVLAAKARIVGESLNRPASLDLAALRGGIAIDAHRAVADRVATAATTLVRGSLSPMPERPLIIATRMARRFGPSVDAQLRSALARIGWENADVLMVDPTPDASQVRKALEQARAARWVALLHFNKVESFDPEAVGVSAELADLAATIAGAEVPVTIVSLGSPYALTRFGSAAATLCAYSTSDAALSSVLHILRGDTAAHGKLPVSLQ
jgi:beta-N-acetylhexosaminidase